MLYYHYEILCFRLRKLFGHKYYCLYILCTYKPLMMVKVYNERDQQNINHANIVWANSNQAKQVCFVRLCRSWDSRLSRIKIKFVQLVKAGQHSFIIEGKTKSWHCFVHWGLNFNSFNYLALNFVFRA